MRANQMVLTDIDCPDCGRKMGIRTATTWRLPRLLRLCPAAQERCKKTINLVSADEFVSRHRRGRGGNRCAACQTSLRDLRHRHGRLHHRRQPQAASAVATRIAMATRWSRGSSSSKGYEGPSIECDRCGSEMQLKNGRFGKYMGCTNESCKNTRKILKNGDIAPPKRIGTPARVEMRPVRRPLRAAGRRRRSLPGRQQLPQIPRDPCATGGGAQALPRSPLPKHQYLADALASDLTQTPRGALQPQDQGSST